MLMNMVVNFVKTVVLSKRNKEGNNIMKNIIEDFEKRMLKIFAREVLRSEGYCKSAEPSITICLSNDLKWSAEIYSYLTDYTPTGGRHHFFEADTFEELVAKIDRAIKEHEEE